MRCRQDYLCIKSYLFPNRIRKMPQHGSGHLQLVENILRQPQSLHQRPVPVPADGADQCRRAGIGVFVCLHAAQDVIQIIRNHQEAPRSFQILRMLAHERRQLINRIKRLVLNAGAGVVLFKGKAVLPFQELSHSVCPLVAVGHRVPDPVTLLIQQNKVHRPGVDADGFRRKAGRMGCLQSLYHFPFQVFNIPAKMAVFPADAVLKAVNLLQVYFPFVYRSDDVAAAGCPDVNCQKALLHVPSPLPALFCIPRRTAQSSA